MGRQSAAPEIFYYPDASSKLTSRHGGQRQTSHLPMSSLVRGVTGGLNGETEEPSSQRESELPSPISFVHK